MLEPNVTAPSWSGMVAVEIVAVLADSVPMVAVPVDAVTLEPKVTAPSWSGIVAVLMEAVEMVAVLIVAVPTERVPIVAVPVDAVRLVPKVTTPDKRLVPSTAKEPVLLTSEVERDNADEMLSPLVMA
jgi:LytS/YehU family sensor histidine kinase